MRVLARSGIGVAVAVAVAALWAAGCVQKVIQPPPDPPPSVFINVPNATVIGTSIKGTTTVNGCKKVAQVQLLASDLSFIADANFTSNPSPWEISGALLNRFYQTKGLALPLTLIAKVVCDDDRTANSTPVSVTFFPVASVTSSGGVQMLPDSFVAEGGIGGTATTFIGCIGTTQGVALARVDTTGAVLKANVALPFSCSYRSVITPRSNANFTRWLLEPGVGAFAFDRDLNITNTIQGPAEQIAVAKDSDAIIWLNGMAGPEDLILRAGVTPVSATQPWKWQVEFAGQMNSTPVIDATVGSVFTSSWQYNRGTTIGDIVVLVFDYATGVITNAVADHVPVLVTQKFSLLNQPIEPFGAFNIDGSILYLPLMAFDANQNVTTSVIACATSEGGCNNNTRRWTSGVFNSVMTTVVPFSSGNFLAVASSSEVYFLSSTDGSVQNKAMVPLRPTGSLITQGLQPGNGADFYVLNGPAADGSYPSEIVATDAPMNGELWRLSVGGGETPTTAMFIAIDDAGQAWLRVGLNQIKPLKNQDYRTARGATLP